MQQVFVDEEALDAHGAARVDAVGTDAHLRTKAIPLSIREPGGCIGVHASRVDIRLEVAYALFGRGYDGVCVVRAMLVDMLHR
eukprot:CAMPEP_0184390830 /NCGR_PEP_ID=MMETSP0007-20130409/13613_1 /TAXON_ID=97485 /ORGANISM="Prymnesium parvum, Strain Texoma1" /LENGTH=82 /DNA_ID=CAMNT_0026740711 /DNA_START=308 /DNA_END=553 /DNA_ORIENTATION=-